jgi:hypothetical protein
VGRNCVLFQEGHRNGTELVAILKYITGNIPSVNDLRFIVYSKFSNLKDDSAKK